MEGVRGPYDRYAILHKNAIFRKSYEIEAGNYITSIPLSDFD